MSTVGLSALAAPGLLGLTSSLLAGGPACEAKPRVRAVFLRPKVDRYWMGWPGACYDIKAREADYAKVMSDTAEKLGVKLEVAAEPITDVAGIDKLLAECKQCPPDGIILTVGTIGPTNYWPLADKFAAAKGDLPTIIFSPMGTSFTGHQQATRTAKKCFVASTQHHEWLADGDADAACDLGHEEHADLPGQRQQDAGPAAGRDRHHAAPHSAGPLDRRGGQAGGEARRCRRWPTS